MVKKVEQMAMDIVMKYEKNNGRKPKDVSKTKCGYDIKSNERCIEVKGQSDEKAEWIWVSNTIVRNLGKDLANYYIYIVYNIQDEPKLKILDPDSVFKNLEIDNQFILKRSAITKYGIDVSI